MNRFDELSLRFCDGELDDAEASELQLLLKDDAVAECFRSTLLIEGELRALARSAASPRIADAVMKTLSQDRSSRTEAIVMTSIQRASPRWRRPADRKPISLPSWKIRCLAFGAIAMILLGTGWYLSQPHDRSVIVATLSIYGRVEPLHAGQVVTTEGNPDSAEIAYPDGTHVEILGNSMVVVQQDSQGGKRLNVLMGAIQADVTPQPAGRPMMISTPTATLEVLGTSFGVEADKKATQLDVSSGRVSMTRKIDGRRVEVAAGQFANASESVNELLTPRPLPQLPDAWSEDFSDGLPNGWQAGVLRSGEDGNVVQAAPDGHGKENNIAVTTHNAWGEGQHALAQLYGDSVLNIRFRQDAPAPLRIMLVTRAYPRESGRFGSNYFYEDDAWSSDLPKGQWRTISVPLAGASYTKKRGRFEYGSPPVDGLAVFMLQVTTLEQDVGLTVDRMWITRE